MNAANEQETPSLNVGDLVEIGCISPATSFFGWSGSRVGIYLGTFEFTHYMNEDEKKTDICHKVWISGETKYVSTTQEILLLAAVEGLNEK